MQKISLGILTLLIMLPFLGMAQNETVVKQELSKFLQDFDKAYVNLPVSKDKNTVLKFFMPDANYSIYSYNIAGQSRIQTLTTQDFGGYLEEITRTDGITLGYDITDQHFTYLSADLATFVYTVKYETKVVNGIWVRGDETVTMSTARKNGEWKVVYFSIVQVEDERLKGNCLCELFSSDGNDGEVVAKLVIPAGRTYMTKFANLNFKTVGDDTLVRLDDETYKRSKTGEIFSLNEAAPKSIGISTTRRETAITILQYSFRNSCSKLSVPK